jgi:hypothetical protein
MQEHSGAAVRSSGGRAGAKTLRLLINPPHLQLDDRTVIFKYTGDGGWFCASFGDGANYMRAAKEDPVLRRRIETRAQNIRRDRRALGTDLARIMAAVELAKDYDPDQARDDHGRWTSEGATAAIAGATADAARMFGNPIYLDGLRALAQRALAAARTAASSVSADAASAAVGDVAAIGEPAAILPAAAFFGTLFVPAPRNLATADGVIADAPGYSYHFDQEAGHLTIQRQLDDGSKEIVFDGRYGKDGVFRDDDGDAIGRFLGDSVALDADAVRGYEARRKSDSAARAGATAQSISIAQTEPKLCPDPTVESIAGRKLPALLYQSQISGLPPGVDFRLINPENGNAVSYDACWPEKAGEMGEAKGPNYFKFMIDPDHWYKWYQGVGQIKEQMARQARAAGDRQVEWHFAEQGPAEYFRQYVKANPVTLSNIHVFYTPPINQ